MKPYALKTPSLASPGRNVRIGLDVEKTSMSATALDQDGNIVLRTTIQDRHDDVAGLVARFPKCQITAVYDAGQNGARLLRWLRDLGCDPFMTPPSLVPTSAGDLVHRGSITRRGNSRCRYAVVEASWTLVRKDPKMKEAFDRIAVKRGTRRAIVAVARRLTNIIYAMLRERTEYNGPAEVSQPNAA